MAPRREHVFSVLQDALLDRETYLEAVATAPDYVPGVERDIAALKALIARYQAGRVALGEDDLALVRLACQWALSWRESFLDSIAHTGDRALIRATRAEIAQAKATLQAAGGSLRDPVFDNAQLVPVHEIRERNLGTMVREERVAGLTIRHVSENGVPFGRVEVDEGGVVKVVLADGKIVNEPFESAFEAQQWLLTRYSNNVVFSWRREQEDEEPGPERPGM